MKLLLTVMGLWFAVQAAAGTAAKRQDILWVMDNSGSMKSRRDYVAYNIRDFINKLKVDGEDVSYRMAVTTTDFFTDQGRLIQDEYGTKFVDPKTPYAHYAFASVVASINDSSTSFWEQGLESGHIAAHTPEMTEGGVPLAIIYLTDEQDWSCREKCWGTEPENNPDWIPWGIERFVMGFEMLKKKNVDVSVYPIVGLDASTCTVASIGSRYLDVLKLWGAGKAGSIRNSQLAESLEAVAKDISLRLKQAGR